MSEWDTGSPEFNQPVSTPDQRPAPPTGGLHISMTLVCFLAVTAVSFGMAYLMKDKVRNFFEMGLTFAAPFAALMGSALLTEHFACQMVPACSRKAQILFAAGTIIAAFVFGCLAEVLHQPVVEEKWEPQYDYVILQDKTVSMRFKKREEPCRKALHSLIDGMADENRVGILAFNDEIVGKAEIRELDEKQRSEIGKAIDTEIPMETVNKNNETIYVGPGENDSVALNAVMRMIDQMEESSRPIRIILVTDAEIEYELDQNNNFKVDKNGNRIIYREKENKRAFESFVKWAEKRNSEGTKPKVELCGIQLGSRMQDMVKDAIKRTGGQIFDQTKPEELAEKLGTLKSEVVIPEPVDTLKATYDGKTADGKPNTAYVILTGALLLLLGLLCGFSLMIMFSLRGQFRFQVILSAMMGLAAFALLNWGKSAGITPAWICEAIAFSLFGLVFMQTNGGMERTVVPKTQDAPVPAEAAGGFEDF